MFGSACSHLMHLSHVTIPSCTRQHPSRPTSHFAFRISHFYTESSVALIYQVHPSITHITFHSNHHVAIPLYRYRSCQRQGYSVDREFPLRFVASLSLASSRVISIDIWVLAFHLNLSVRSSHGPSLHPRLPSRGCYRLVPGLQVSRRPRL